MTQKPIQLLEYRSNITSSAGEDGIIAKIFQLYNKIPRAQITILCCRAAHPKIV